MKKEIMVDLEVIYIFVEEDKSLAGIIFSKFPSCIELNLFDLLVNIFIIRKITNITITANIILCNAMIYYIIRNFLKFTSI